MANSGYINGALSRASELSNGGATSHANGAASFQQQHEAGVMPIAIVGMSCRFPGASSSPAKLWDMLANKRSGWSRVPAERFTQTSFEHPSSSVGGTFNSQGAHFLAEDISLFDAPAFSISPLEAKSMDPQMRLLLEVAYESLENGGITLDAIAGSKTGVYMGVFSDDYGNMMLTDPESLPPHHVTGTGKAIFANRISYYFNLKGPSFSLDTGCSASLVALHQACQSIRCGESKQAIVGGTNLILSPKTMMSLGGLGFLSDDGRCYSFDSRGSGYGRGEGVASIVIKPLEDAIANGDPIRAIIRNTAVNQDGKTPGLTMPSREAQMNLIQDTYSQAGLDPLLTPYVEAHGTGTKAGDPIEVDAIAAALSRSRDPSKPLLVGSVKSNIGHLESASGLAGLIKAVLCLERGMVPPSVNFETVNPALRLEEKSMRIATELERWPEGTLRRASLNSFGYGGTNAHVILDAFDGDQISEQALNGTNHDDRSTAKGRRRVFLLSHRTKAGVQKVAADLKDYIAFYKDSATDRFLKNLAYSLNVRRTAFDWRVAVNAASPEELLRVLDAQTLEPKRLSPGERLSFIFTGQGAQWFGMGRELIGRYPTFRSALTAANTHFHSLGASWSLIDELMKPVESSRVNDAAVGQPLCTAIQCALVDLLASWNVKPSSVTGHSSGEIAAAYACGSVLFESALTISYHRGFLASTRLEGNPKLRGAMLAAGISETEAASFISKIPPGSGQAVVACVNSPRSTTLSGDSEAIMGIQSMLEAQHIFARKLGIGTAYHSHHMQIIADSYQAALQTLPSPSPNGSITFFSSVTGVEAAGEDLDAAYWVKNMVSQVKFSASLQTLHSAVASDKGHTLLEIGPHGALAGFCKQILGDSAGKPCRHISTLSRGKDAIQTMLTAVSQLAVLGYQIDLQAVNGPDDKHQPSFLTDLPTYPWDHSTRYWHESRMSIDYRQRSTPRLPLLGAQSPYSSRLEPSWRNIIRVSEIPWIRGHLIQSNIVYPAAGFVTMAVEALSQRSRLDPKHAAISRFHLKHVSISRPLIIPTNQEGIETQFVLRPYNTSARKSSDHWDEFRVFSFSQSDGWSEHCRGLITAFRSQESHEVEGDGEMNKVSARHLETFEIARTTCTKRTDTVILYETLKDLGIGFRDAFHCIENASVGGHESLGHIRIPNTAAVMPAGIEHPHVIHPSTLDACMQMTSPTLLDAGVLQVPMVPTFIEAIDIAADVPTKAGERLLVHSDTELQGKRSFKANIIARPVEASGLKPTAIEIRGLVCTAIPGVVPVRSSDAGKYHKLGWELAALHCAVNPPGNVTLIQPVNPSPMTQSTVSSLCSLLGNRLVQVSSNILDIVDSALNGKVCICLAEMDDRILENCTASQWSALKQMLCSPSRLIWVTRGGAGEVATPQAGLITGLARAARSDNNALHLVTCDLDRKQTSPGDAATHISAILKTAFGAEHEGEEALDVEFVERFGQMYVPRVVEDQSLHAHSSSKESEAATEVQSFFQPGRSLRLMVATPGLLDSLRFVEDRSASVPLAPNQLRMQPRAYGVNFRDVMIALGQLEETSLMSSEHSGFITEVGSDLRDRTRVGDRICAWGGMAYAGSVTVNGDAVQRIPDEMSFETAASIPIVYATAYYALVHLARLQKGESVLIHSAAGGVGQAAVMLAKALGARVFVTVGSSAKKELVMKAHGIPEDHIFSSRRLSFADGVKRLTQGRGVDVLLNSLAGEPFHESFDCLAKLGRFIEIGKRDILDRSRLDMGTFNKSVTFASVDLTILFEHDPLLAKRMLGEVFALLADGKLQPVQPLNVFPLSEMESAFRLIQAGKHTGKVILQADERTAVKAVPPPIAPATFLENASYLLIGGLGGLGREICRWMVSRNCKNLIVLSRSGMQSTHAQTVKDELERNGVKLAIYKCDVGEVEQLRMVLVSCSSAMPPIRGVIQSAMVIRDNLINKMSVEDYHAALRPKVQGSINLHEALQDQRLDFFIMLSSVVGIIGNNGQANYASACTFQDAFARYRTGLGLPTRSIDIGMIEDAGYVSEHAEALRFLTAQGFRGVKVKELLAVIDYAIMQPIRDTDDCQLMIGLEAASSSTTGSLAANFSDAKFCQLRSQRNAATGSGVSSNATQASNSLPRQLQSAQSAMDEHRVLLEAIVAQIAKVLVVPAEDINPAQSISHYGGDSLSAVELRNWFARELEASFGVMEILSGRSIEAVAGEVLARSKVVQDARAEKEEKNKKKEGVETNGVDGV
ncbi:MAG: hypothetical protein Q9207_006939 [Kuettlingeria erythrocarpa]